MHVFTDKAIGDGVELVGKQVNEEIRKEFTIIKKRCMIETRRKCEEAIRNEIDEFQFQIKQGQLAQEADITAKVDLLRQIMLECLESITFAEKESFVNQKCAEMSAMAHKHLLQDQKLKGI